MESPKEVNIHHNKIEKPHIIIVEGNDESVFFNRLTKTLQLEVQITSIDGKTNFKKELASLVLRSEFNIVTHMAIILDSDKEEKAAFDSICQNLANRGLPAPTAVGEIAENDGKRIGIYLMPGAGNQGALEELLLDCISNTHPLDCIAPYWQCLESLAGEEQIKLPKNRMKFKLRTLLAAMEEDTRSIGQAMDKGYIDVNHPNLDPLRTFLRKLFAP
ncbi:MAG: hypothetical protein HQL55_06575 [Magnetococcales bacterium]|nr:hypothetical protein [Magnetococcales bacterium]